MYFLFQDSRKKSIFHYSLFCSSPSLSEFLLLAKKNHKLRNGLSVKKIGIIPTIWTRECNRRNWLKRQWRAERWVKEHWSMVRRRQWHPTPVRLPGKSHGWRSLVGYSPWGRTESDMTERLHFHFSLSCIGERNGNPLQCSYLENPRDGEAWWAAVYGVAQSRTWLKWLSSSRSMIEEATTPRAEMTERREWES